MQLFMEPLQIMVDLEYEVLREETVQYLGSIINTFVIRQRFSGIESTLWVAHDGTVFRETTNMGFESFKEEPEIAQKIDEAITISNIIDKTINRTKTIN